MRRLTPFLEKFGGNVAGFFWNIGTALQLIFGLAALSTSEIASAFFNFAAPCSYLVFGHRNAGIVAGGILGIIGLFLAVYPQLRSLEAGSTLGFAAFVVFVSMNIFSVPLTRRFGGAKNAALRETLGRPRRLAGLGPFFLTRLPIIIESLSAHQARLALVFAIWGMGDIALSFSRAKIAPKDEKNSI